MATAEVLFSTSSIPESRVFNMGSPRTLEMGMPNAIIGRRPKELNQISLNKSCTNKNVGLSAATAYQAIHVPQSRRAYPYTTGDSYRFKPSFTKSQLPNLIQRNGGKRFHKQASQVKSPALSTSASRTTLSQSRDNPLPVRPRTSAGKVTYSSMSANWNFDYAGITANGQGLRKGTSKKQSMHSMGLTPRSNMVPGSHLPHQTLVNYIPFSEQRAKVDEDVPAVATALPISFKTHSSEDIGIKEAGKTPGTDEKNRPRSVLKNSRPESPEWPGASGKQPSYYGNQEKKRVRFSSTVSDKMEEPAYVETLLNSVSKRLQNGPKAWTIPAEKADSGKVDRPMPGGTKDAAWTLNDDDSTNIVSPITKVTVTRRKVSEEHLKVQELMTVQGTRAAGQNPPDHAHKNTSQQKILDMATKILNYASHSGTNSDSPGPKRRDSPRNEIHSGPRLPVRNATGFVTTRTFGKSVPISKYIQKRQTILTASFPEQRQRNPKNFPSYSTRLAKFKTPVVRPQNIVLSPAVTSQNSVQKHSNATYHQTAPLSGKASKQQVTCTSIDLRISNLAPQDSAVITTSNDTPRSYSSLLPANATHFQPLPSMPDHVNFCDPRKTEHILVWLDDVNKKRNIRPRFKRGPSSMSARTIS